MCIVCAQLYFKVKIMLCGGIPLHKDDHGYVLLTAICYTSIQWPLTCMTCAQFLLRFKWKWNLNSHPAQNTKLYAYQKKIKHSISQSECTPSDSTYVQVCWKLLQQMVHLVLVVGQPLILSNYYYWISIQQHHRRIWSSTWPVLA